MSGVKRALLVGSQTGKLQGADRDVRRMADLLSAQGWQDLAVRTGKDANRHDILRAYDTLIDDARKDDTICVYYSGHGNMARNPYYREGKRVPPVLQYLIPTDDSPGDFRGIMNFELSQRLARLTRQTRNVTVILDCCHSARMSRAVQDPGLVPKGGASRVNEQALADLLAKIYPDEALLDVESNPYALRLVAAEAHTEAFERLDAKGEATGAFTEALLQSFSEVGTDPVSWNAVMLRVRELVMALIPGQRPNAEGPRRRRLWALEELPDERALPLFFDGDLPRIRGGALLGVVVGASYGLMPPHADAYAPARSLGTAVVVDILGSVSRVRVEGGDPARLPRTGVLAFPLSVPFPRCRVALGGGVPGTLRARLLENRYVVPADGLTAAPLPVVTATGSSLELRDSEGNLLLQEPSANLDPLVDRLERLARAEYLRRFEPGGLDADLQISFGRVAGGQLITMHAGDLLHVGDHQFIRVLNDGIEPVHVAVLGIDPAHDVQLVLTRNPRGQRLAAAEALTVGQNSLGSTPGVKLSWPAGLPRDNPRRETIIVLATKDEQDFQLLTTDNRTRAGTTTSLEARLAQLRGGTARSRGAAANARSEYKLYRIDYQLSPAARGT